MVPARDLQPIVKPKSQSGENVFTQIIPEIVNQEVKISSLIKTGDMFDI